MPNFYWYIMRIWNFLTYVGSGNILSFRVNMADNCWRLAHIAMWLKRLFFCAGRNHQQNQSYQNIETELKNVEKIRIQIMNLMNWALFMPWLLLGRWIFCQLPTSNSLIVFHSLTWSHIFKDLYVLIIVVVINCSAADAHKLSIEKSKYLGGKCWESWLPNICFCFWNISYCLAHGLLYFKSKCPLYALSGNAKLKDLGHELF